MADDAAVPSAGRTTTGLETLPALAPSVGALFFSRVETDPAREAFRSPKPSGGWESWTWGRSADRVVELAAGLLALGLQPEDRVAIAMNTRIEWIFVDLAIMASGGATTTVYPSTQADDVAYIISDSGSRYVVVEDAAQLAKLVDQREAVPAVERVIILDTSKADLSTRTDEWVITLDDLAARGRTLLAADPDAVKRANDAVTSDKLATLIYTSGTTGRPKGVELTHGNWTYEGAGAEAIELVHKDQLHFLWLPLSHSFGKVLLAAQMQIGFTTAVDGRVDKIVDNLGEIKPHLMAGAPRIFEKVYASVVSRTEAEGGAKAKIFHWAIGVGKQVAALEEQGTNVPMTLSVQHSLAERLVFSKVKERMGGRIETFISGSAALSKDVASWFEAIGLPILEGYGLTETSAGSCVNRNGKVKVGTVGRPFPGTEVKIASDGEILVRGGGVMRGYYHLPEQTAEVLVGDGWFATGDIGEIDDDGNLKITDRKKDLIKTSGGKYIAPSLIEARFKALCPLLGNVLVHANGRNYATAIVTLDPDVTKAFAEHHHIAGGPESWASDPHIDKAVRDAMAELNADLNRWETIKDVRILPRDLSVEDGELTPSLKIKRKVVEEHYAELLQSMYPNG
ncbi:MAG TPA: long-chain fatty acid--CoA ligase [Candidatus Nanopelagicales bacterium]|nr:long-chain fatty acid--CoA ligase [Candidatus Nanopelagicales bacterium]